VPFANFGTRRVPFANFGTRRVPFANFGTRRVPFANFGTRRVPTTLQLAIMWRIQLCGVDRSVGGFLALRSFFCAT